MAQDSAVGHGSRCPFVGCGLVERQLDRCGGAVEGRRDPVSHAQYGIAWHLGRGIGSELPKECIGGPYLERFNRRHAYGIHAREWRFQCWDVHPEHCCRRVYAAGDGGREHCKQYDSSAGPRSNINIDRHRVGYCRGVGHPGEQSDKYADKCADEQSDKCADEQSDTYASYAN
jgi:hypothetical protein